MAFPSLRAEHERYARVESVRLGGVPLAVEWLPYGEGAGPAREIVATFGVLELEYAAFRRGAALMERADRGTVVVRGAEGVEFLNRMVTQDLKGLQAGEAREAFWLNRKGRIEADLLVCAMPGSAAGDAGASGMGERSTGAADAPGALLLDVDAHDAARTVETLREFFFGEDVTIEDSSAAWSRVSVHGPLAGELLAGAGAATDEVRALGADLRCASLALAEVPVRAARRDQCAAPGVELWIPAEHAARVWDALVSQQDHAAAGRRRARPAGWYAYNIARIEGGTPLFHVDFGPENLPHETGVLGRRTSFRKGCYLGQEIVARMESLGHPKQRVVALRTEEDLLPTAGSPVFERGANGEPGNPVGVVTSSALSPMLGAVPVAFAMVRHAHSAPGTVLLAPAEGGRTAVTVQPDLAFLRTEAPAP
jgi:folate-binding protein YgfZ